MRRTGYLWLALVCTSSGLALGFGAGWQARGKEAAAARFDKVVVAAELIEQKYVQPVTDGALEEAAVRGMLGSLDPHSTYFSAADAADFREHLDRRFTGVGIRIEPDPETQLIRVVAPIEGSPALRAGILPGDLIAEVDGVSIQGTPIDDVSRKIRGQEGTEVRLKIFRRAGEHDWEPHEYTLLRTEIELPSVAHRMIDAGAGIGYLRIREFGEGTSAEFVDALNDLQASGARSLVLDLRFNSGGYLAEAVRIADEFLGEGVIASVRGRTRAPETHTSDEQIHPLLRGARVAVLVNGSSASASEILAGALHDRGVGRLFGTRTFGKGSVQDLIPLADGSMLKITTARYYLPSGRCVHREPGAETWGIDPDQEAAMTPEQEGVLMASWGRETPETAPGEDPPLDAAVEWLKAP